MKKRYVEVLKYIDLICERDGLNYEDQLVLISRDIMIDSCRNSTKNVGEYKMLLSKIESVNE